MHDLYWQAAEAPMKTLSLITVTAWATVGALASMAAATEPKLVSAKKKIEMPRRPPEVAEHLTHMAGTWTCQGKAWMPDGSEHVMAGKLPVSKHFDGYWGREEFVDKMDVFPFKFDAYTTYDANAKKWRRVGIDSLGGQMIGTSDGMKDMKVDYETEVTGPMGVVMLREHTDASDPKAVKVNAERSLDKGKSWQKDYELVCKK